MSISEARIETERATQYLVQLCEHASAIGRSHEDRPGVQVKAEWSDTEGTIAFTPWGRCTLHADNDALTLRIEATEQEDLQRIQGIIASHLTRFSRNKLSVKWRRMETRRNGPTIADGDKPASRCSRIKRIALPGVALIALLIALHLGLGGAIVASAEWSSLAIGIVGAVVLLKIGLVILGGFGIHRHRPAKAFRAHLSKGRASALSKSLGPASTTRSTAAVCS